jgi:hypothetical protein
LSAFGLSIAQLAVAAPVGFLVGFAVGLMWGRRYEIVRRNGRRRPDAASSSTRAYSRDRTPY